MGWVIIIWLLLCVLVGVVADGRGRSALGFVALSLFLSPLVGIALVLAFKDLKAEQAEKTRLALEEEKRDETRRREHEAHVASIQALAGGRAFNPSPLSAADEIAKLADLLGRGLLTDEEFRAQKAAVLARAGL